MDTKWKKSKIILSSAAFFLGVSLLIGNLAPVAGILLSRGSFEYRWNGDYQESENFSWSISRQLGSLLGVATGGKSFQYYGTMDYDFVTEAEGWYGNYYEIEAVADTVQDAIQELEWQLVDLEELTDDSDEITSRLEEIQAELVRLNTQMEQQETDRKAGSEDRADRTAQEILDAYMAEKAQDKNLRYAVVYQGKLLYTNIDTLEGAAGKAWDGRDFYEQLSQEEYNFALWFNRNGDGKAEIIKDGKSVDVYGGGVYTEESRWYIPGYTNFNTDSAAEEAVIFLAAAKEPKVYVAGNYSGHGTTEYGNEWYHMYVNTHQRQRRLWTNCILSLAGILLVILSLIWGRERRQGIQAAASILGKIWLELKLLILAVLLASMVIFLFREDWSWWFESARIFAWESGYWWTEGMDVTYCIQELLRQGTFLTICFWTVYLIVLDIRTNRGRQKKPLIDSLCTGSLRYPLQKRLVRRYCMIFVTAFLGLMLCVIFLGFLLVNTWDGYVFGYQLNWIPWNLLLIISMVVIGILLLFCIIVSAIYWKENRQLAEDIGALADQIQTVKEGNLMQPLRLSEDADLKQAAENLNEIQHGMEAALREQVQSERMKVDLVTNVSHDIKTPLTSIVSYVDLLKQEENLPPHVEEFIQILDQKSERLTTMVQDVFDISKATSGQLPVTMEELNLGKLLRQTLADMDTSIVESGLIMKTAIPEAPVFIRADGQRLYRVFQNLIQNALKYSLAGSRIFLSLTVAEGRSIVRIRNTSGTELDDTKDFTERFLRGDASRTDGGSGLGLSIAKSFTEACGGSFRVEVDGDLFTAIVMFSINRGE